MQIFSASQAEFHFLRARSILKLRKHVCKQEGPTFANPPWKLHPQPQIHLLHKFELVIEASRLG